jgi:hypothetical protein
MAPEFPDDFAQVGSVLLDAVVTSALTSVNVDSPMYLSWHSRGLKWLIR